MAEEVRARGEDAQDLAGLVSRYRRHVPMVVLIAFALMVLAGVATMFMPKQYTSTAELTFDPQGQPIRTDNTKGDPTLSDQARDAAVDAQVQIVNSLPVARMVVQDMHLERDPDLVAVAASQGGTVADRTDALAAAALNNLRVRRVGQTSLFDVSYTDKQPLQSTEVANSFANAYLKQQVIQKVAESQQDSALLDKRLDLLRQQVERSDQAVAEFRRQHNILTPPDSPNADQEVSAVNQQLAEARAAQAETDARYAATQRLAASGADAVAAPSSGSDAGDYADALASPVIAGLRQQKAEVSRKVADLSSRYGPKHPDLLEAQNELSEINSQINQELQRVLNNVRAQTTIAGQRTASLSASRADAQARLANTVSSGVVLADLMRQQTTARTLYEGLLATSQQESASRDLVQPDARLTSPASPPLKPSSPNLAINLLLGLVLGTAIGVAIAFLRERWSVGLNTIDDVDRLLDQNYLNSIPTLASSIDAPKTKEPVDAVMAHPLSLFSESFRSLATSLLYGEQAGKTKVIGVTSALPKEGKSTTSSAMARVLAMSGSKVLLMDADLRRRSVTMAMAPNASVGLIEVLSGAAELADALVADASGASILPLAPNAHVGAQPFDTPAFDSLMTHLRSVYDVIVVDTAPVLAVVDTRLLLRHLDTLALLARWRTTPVKAIRAAIHQVETVGGHIHGVAMTFVNLKTQAQSGYGDASYYYREMKDYYAAAE